MVVMSLIATALAGELVVDARVPVEIEVQHQKIAVLYEPGIVRFVRDPGPLSLVVLTDGNPTAVDVTIPKEGAAVLLVGRSGITSSLDQPLAIPGPTSIELRNGGARAVQIRLDGKAYTVEPSRPQVVALPTGSYRFEVRDPSGTALWAHGRLQVAGGSVVVQASEGVMPEVAGERARFLPDGS